MSNKEQATEYPVVATKNFSDDRFGAVRRSDTINAKSAQAQRELLQSGLAVEVGAPLVKARPAISNKAAPDPSNKDATGGPRPAWLSSGADQASPDSTAKKSSRGAAVDVAPTRAKVQPVKGKGKAKRGG